MNREIKFRYYSNRKGMLGVDKVNLECKLVISYKEKGDYIPQYYDGEYKEGELMQYIGLKDKNGKEIYEGDIIKIKFDYADNILDNYKGAKIIHKVMMQLGDDYMHNMANTEQKYLEVIGNIYENPDLISKQTKGH